MEYVNASRARTVLMQAMNDTFAAIDVLVMPSFGNAGLRITNLTGHPSVTLPNHFSIVDDSPVAARRNPASFTIVGGLYEDEAALSLATFYQSRTQFHLERPPIE